MPPETSTLPLDGFKVVEFAGLAPGPFAGMILADWGASVIRVDKHNPGPRVTTDVLSRGKRSIAIDPKVPEGLAALKRLVNQADVLIDPFRPGVLERLGLGPSVFLHSLTGSNKRLIFARMRGFPSTGAQKDMAGHDLNYLAQSGVLSLLPPSSPSGKPSFPINLLADFAGGGLMCALGILLALLERQRSGLGQVVDTNMVDGARYVSSFPIIQNLAGSPVFAQPPGQNVLDGGAPFYNLYQCQDGGWMSVACLEPQFFKAFLTILQSTLPTSWTSPIVGYKPTPSSQSDTENWPRLELYLEHAFKTLPRDEWARAFHGSDACATPVLDLEEAKIANRSSMPTPQPHLERTPANVNDEVPEQFLLAGEHTDVILQELGITGEEKATLFKSGALGGKSIAKL